MTDKKLTAASLAAQAMGWIDPVTKAVVPPIHMASTYLRDEDNGYSTGFIYGRPDNETVHEAQAVLAMLEEAKADAKALAGMKNTVTVWWSGALAWACRAACVLGWRGALAGGGPKTATAGLLPQQA